jgi:uncharacterized membrane protein YeaQ/YmgE (transglycosylase-associated protein family)
MSTALFILWISIGFTFANRLPSVSGSDPWPEPDPKPKPNQSILRWMIVKVIGVIGGMLGGWLYTRFFFSAIPISGVEVAATTVGVLIGSLISLEIVSIGLWVSRGLFDRGNHPK